MPHDEITLRAPRRGWNAHPASGPALGAVPLIIESPCASAAIQPVTVGIPFPGGALKDRGAVTLRDPTGADVPVQSAALARWPDGSVKWLLVDFGIGPLVGGRGTWSLEFDRGSRPDRERSEGPLRVREEDAGIVVETGPASFAIDRATLAPIAQVWIDGGPILDPARTGTALVDSRGRARRLVVERSRIEATGPVRATILLEGVVAGRDRLRFRARLSFFAGSCLIRVDLTLHNPRRARHRGGLWDLGDPHSAFFRDLSLRLGLGAPRPSRVEWVEDPDGTPGANEAGTVEIYQDSSGGENWRSRNHVNRKGEVPLRFRGYRVRAGDESSCGLRANPVASIRGPAASVTAAIPEFWQQFPKAIDTEGGTLNLRFFPGQFGDSFELQGGEQKTHTAWIHFGRGGRSEIDALRWVHRPARVHCRPEWYAETRVILYLSPSESDPADRFDPFIAGVVDGPRRLDSRREIIDEYGWRNYGEIYADHEQAYFKGEGRVVSHYNNQYDVINGLLAQYLRTGDPRWFDLADPLARHVMDIDIYHTTEDKAAYNGGLFWHTDHYLDVATATHRAYSRANRGPLGRAYGGGPSNEHNYTTGLLQYYYLTGDPRAREAVLSLADWVVARDDGRRTIFGLIDEGPTGWASATTQPGYHGPGRGGGNSVNALLDGWLLSGTRDYLDKAEELIRRVIHPAMDIPALDLLDAEVNWSYTVFLSVLSRYLDLKAEMGEIDRMYAYGRSSLLAFATWMLDHEVPYLDRPEKLEFPTETWATQELRKANVLRLAARHADDPLRSRLIRRGGELADRAWSDLMRFPSRDVARSLALVMAEGGRDAYWRRHPVGVMPAPAQEFDFGSPQTFVPQKRRVLDRLRTPRGALEALPRLANPGNWRRYVNLRNRPGDRRVGGRIAAVSGASDVNRPTRIEPGGTSKDKTS